MIQGLYHITVVSRDTWGGVTFTVTVNGSPLNLTGASILMQARQSRALPVVFSASTTDETIIVTTPASGSFRIKEGIVSAAPGVYLYDVQITLQSREVKTYIHGTFTVLEDITNAG